MSRPTVVIVCILAPPNRGGLNSTHIHGTSVPVEEPSIASKADICIAADLFDHLVGTGEQRGRQVDIQRLSGPTVDCQLKLYRRLDGQLGRPSAFQDAVDISRGSVEPVSNEAAAPHESRG